MSTAKVEPKPKYISGGFFGLDSTIGNLLGGLLSNGIISTVKHLFEGDEKKPQENPFKKTYYTLLNTDTSVKDIDNKIMSLLDAISIQNPKMKYKKEDMEATDKKDVANTSNPLLVNSDSPLDTNVDLKNPTENLNENEKKTGVDSAADIPGVPTGVPGMPKTMNISDVLKPSDVLGMFIDPNKMKVLAGLVIQNQDDLGNSLVSRNPEGIPNYLSKVFETENIKELVEEGKAKYLNNLKTKKSVIHDVFLESLKKKLKDMVLKDKDSKIEFCKKFNEVFACTK